MISLIMMLYSANIYFLYTIVFTNFYGVIRLDTTLASHCFTMCNILIIITYIVFNHGNITSYSST